MRARGAIVALVAAGAITTYGACTETRLHPIAAADGGEPPAGETDAGGATGEDASSASDATTEARDAGGDGSTESAWPCPPPSDAGTTFDREWMTGPVPPASPGAASYAVRADTVCDRITLLEWERFPKEELRTWSEAAAYCDSLLLGGVSDWRLPTRIELLTIVDYARKEPSIDPVAFPDTPSANFWTATPMSNQFQSPNAYRVTFDFGHAWPFTKTDPAHVRCVRGGR